MRTFGCRKRDGEIMWLHCNLKNKRNNKYKFTDTSVCGCVVFGDWWEKLTQLGESLCIGTTKIIFSSVVLSFQKFKIEELASTQREKANPINLQAGDSSSVKVMYFLLSLLPEAPPLRPAWLFPAFSAPNYYPISGQVSVMLWPK